MERPNAPSSTFVKPCKEFSRAWKKARSKASEKSIHYLRVSTRRLIANLELVQAVSDSRKIEGVEKEFKKVLKQMGPLRDVQVQLENLERLRVNGVIMDFKRTLERREINEVRAIRKDLKGGKRRRLEKGIRNLHADFEKLRKAPSDPIVSRSIEQLIRLRRSEFFKARQRFKPGNDKTMHEMRIALKKLRYVVEAAQPILGDWATESAGKMQAYQQLMGTARDLEILRTDLETWASKRGKKVAVVPVLERLTEKRERLIKNIAKSSDMLEHIFPIQHSRPAKEITRAASQRRLRASAAIESEAAADANSNTKG